MSSNWTPPKDPLAYQSEKLKQYNEAEKEKALSHLRECVKQTLNETETHSTFELQRFYFNGPPDIQETFFNAALDEAKAFYPSAYRVIPENRSGDLYIRVEWSQP